MRQFLTIFLLFISGLLCGQPQYNNETDKLGIGIIAVKNTYKQTNKTVFYNDKDLKTNAGNFFINNPDKNKYPKFYKPDYGICYFVCTEKTNKYFKILVNKSEERYIATDTNVTFKTWDNLLLESTGIKRLDKQNLFRAEPTDKSKVVSIDNQDEIYKAEKVINEWIKIIDKKTNKSGWIKWKDKDKLMIDILLLD